MDLVVDVDLDGGGDGDLDLASVPLTMPARDAEPVGV